MYSKHSYNYGRHGRKRRLKPISFIAFNFVSRETKKEYHYLE